jgi:outer membrane lipoprotein
MGWQRRSVWMAAAAGLALVACGCEYPISRALRQAAAGGPSFTTVAANPDAYRGRIVIWGGVILQAAPVAQGSELSVLQTPLDSWEEPLDARFSQGRFFVKSPRFLDPTLYQQGKRVTVAGTVGGKQTEPLAQGAYAWPVIDALELYLWPPETFLFAYAPPPPYWGWAWGLYGPDWDWW